MIQNKKQAFLAFKLYKNKPKATIKICIGFIYYSFPFRYDPFPL